MKCEFGARKKRQNNETIFGCGASNIETVSPEKENNQSRLPKKTYTYTVWQILHFSVTQILREMDFGECKSPKYAIFIT